LTDVRRREGWITVSRQMDHKETGRRVPLKMKGLSERRVLPPVASRPAPGIEIVASRP
jgi:hypothetical protein